MSDMKKVEVEIKVAVPENLRVARYANFINMDATDHEITIDFIYVNKRDNPSGTLASRIVLPVEMLEKITDNFVQLLEVRGRKVKK